MRTAFFLTLALSSTLSLIHPVTVSAQEDSLPTYLRDRGTGIPTSMFGTYVRRGELLAYPFYEYYRDRNFEYEPADFGFGSTTELRGDYRAHEGLIFLGLGVTNRLSIELEAAAIDARLVKSPEDTSALPDTLAESGLGDVEAQIRWRWSEETTTHPEFFSYFETAFPFQSDRLLIGTQDWEFKLGLGVIKGFRWGTLTLRAAASYDAGEKGIAPGEYAVEYLKRISDLVRVVAAVEGEDDEVVLITELQLRLGGGVRLKLNNGFGLTSKATDLAPELGVMFSTRVF